MNTPIFASYTAQTWRGVTRPIPDITGLSFDAAREIAQTHAALGYTGRIVAEGPHDYMEVYTPDGSVRRGTFAQTTLVIVEEEVR